MKLYVEDEEGDAVWVKATLPRPPEQYEPGLVVDAVVRGRPMSVKLPPEEMYQQEGLDMENCDDLVIWGTSTRRRSWTRSKRGPIVASPIPRRETWWWP